MGYFIRRVAPPRVGASFDADEALQVKIGPDRPMYRVQANHRRVDPS